MAPRQHLSTVADTLLTAALLGLGFNALSQRISQFSPSSSEELDTRMTPSMSACGRSSASGISSLHLRSSKDLRFVASFLFALFVAFRSRFTEVSMA